MKRLPAQVPSAVMADTKGGFLPDEKVGVAIIVSHQAADCEGNLDKQRLVEVLDHQAADLVVLVGRTSGNLVIGALR